MSEPTDMPPAEPPSSAEPAVPRQRGACLGRLLSALLVVLITTFISLAAVLLAYLYILETPTQIADLRSRAATAEAQSASLRLQNDTMQTQVADLSRRVDVNREALGELQQQKAALDGLRAELEAAARQNATVVAEAHAGRDTIALFATAEAGRAGLLDDLKRRSERIERFLQRLSDISDDAALDLGASVSPSPSASSTTQPDSSTVTPTPLPTSTPSPAPSDTPTVEPTASRRATTTPRAEPTAPADSTTIPTP
jgi:cell division protein FtsL